MSSSESLVEKIKTTSSYLVNKTGPFKPEIGIILGSGLGNFAKKIETSFVLDYKDIPHFPLPTAEGHEGKLLFGKLANKNIMCMQGRFHYYEGHSMDILAFPVWVMKSLGVKTLILTNASGSLIEDWKAGELVLITDHIKLAPQSPTRGINKELFGPVFYDTSNTYSKDLQTLAKKEAQNLGITLREGVYMYFSGPNYETIAEGKLAQKMGASIVGMSSVPEALAASQCGMRVLAFSAITALCSCVSTEIVNHEDVLRITNNMIGDFNALLEACIAQI